MGTKKESLSQIVGAENVLDDPAVLADYAEDESLAAPLMPWFVVRPGDAAEVQKLVLWANETATPLVAVSSGPPHFHGDTVPGVPEAVIVDLGRMKAIKRIDRRNRIAVIEPGVTYSELDVALAERGLRIARPLSPRPNKSIVASLLERQPTLIPRLNYSLPEPLRTCGVVWGTGEVAFTGEAGRPGVARRAMAARSAQVRPQGAAGDRPDAAGDRRRDRWESSCGPRSGSSSCPPYTATASCRRRRSATWSSSATSSSGRGSATRWRF